MTVLFFFSPNAESPIKLGANNLPGRQCRVLLPINECTRNANGDTTAK